MTQNLLETLTSVSKLLTFQIPHVRELETIRYAFGNNESLTNTNIVEILQYGQFAKSIIFCCFLKWQYFYFKHHTEHFKPLIELVYAIDRHV